MVESKIYQSIAKPMTKTSSQKKWYDIDITPNGAKGIERI